MTNELVYSERLQSNRTAALFVGFSTLFFVLFVWHVRVASYDKWSILFLSLSVFFLFYVFNYRTLTIRLTQEKLRLKFGIFTWAMTISNIADCQIDAIPKTIQRGGAGIHFMFIKGRYRASLNFLEHPRVVIALKVKQGPVRDVSFSTQQPDKIVRLIKKMTALHNPDQ